MPEMPGMNVSRAVAGQFIAVCYAIFLIYWIVAAFWTKRTATKTGWLNFWLIRLAVAAVLLLYTRRAAPGGADRILWAYTPAIGIVAMALTALGLMILVWARATLAGNWSADVVLKENHELIERGPYRYVRHPIYTGVILMACGGVLLWSTTVALAVLIGIFILLWLKLSREERLLTTHFPNEYPRYKSRVKALIPFVI
jgi:protein-S-isoprenylcysteine O-methyltransferase Ste14